MNEIERRDAGTNILRAFAVDNREFEERASGSRSIDFVCSTEDRDSYGTVIDQASWKLDRYRKNPVVYFNHRTSGGWLGDGEPKNEIPIARAENVRVENKQLLARFVFPPKGEFELSDQIFDALKSKRLNATSVGFKPGKVAKETVDGAEFYRLFDCELYEISIVGIPANPNCIAERSLLASLAAPPGADTPAATDAAPTPAPSASTESRMNEILARLLGCSADDASIVAAIEALKTRAAEPKIEAMALATTDDKRIADLESTIADLAGSLRGVAESLGITAEGDADVSVADMARAIVALQSRAAKADELEPRVAELAKRVDDHEAAIAEREVNFIVTRGKQYGLSVDERSKKALLALRKADPASFAEDYKAALDGLRAFDASELFERVAPEPSKTEPVPPAADEKAEFDARVDAYVQKHGCARSVAMDAVIKNRDL